MKRFSVLLCLLLFAGPSLLVADVFDRHTSYWLKQAAKADKPFDGLSLERAARIKTLARNISSPAIVVKTNEANWAKALVGWGFRKGNDKPTPVLLIERFVTYRGDRDDLTSAVGKDVMLFAGFSFNFDIGQVVPAGQGGDIEFTADGVIKPLGEAQLFALDGSQLPEANAAEKYDPTDHDGVLPRDFSGTWNVNADGRWYGVWELKVEENGVASGSYTSAESKSSYDIAGKVTATPHNIRLSIELANAQQAVDAYLWTKDKSVMAGTVTLAGRKFGFYATRQQDDAKPAGK